MSVSLFETFAQGKLLKTLGNWRKVYAVNSVKISNNSNRQVDKNASE